MRDVPTVDTVSEEYADPVDIQRRRPHTETETGTKTRKKEKTEKQSIALDECRSEGPAIPVISEPSEPLTDWEEASIAANRKRKADRRPHLRVAVSSSQASGLTEIMLAHRHDTVGAPLFCESLGTSDTVVASFVTQQLAQLAAMDGEVREGLLNSHLAMVQSIAPKDEIELMLACQMTAIHVLTMGTAGSLAQTPQGERREGPTAQLTKLARTFTNQVEALKRHRSSGEQKVTVEHVTVNEGGQAIVGNVDNGGRGGR